MPFSGIALLVAGVILAIGVHWIAGVICIVLGLGLIARAVMAGNQPG